MNDKKLLLQHFLESILFFVVMLTSQISVNKAFLRLSVRGKKI